MILWLWRCLTCSVRGHRYHRGLKICLRCGHAAPWRDGNLVCICRGCSNPPINFFAANPMNWFCTEHTYPKEGLSTEQVAHLEAALANPNYELEE